MAQYDLWLTQNIASSGVEFSEKVVSIGHGGLLTQKSDGSPIALARGTNGYMLVADSTVASGLKWQAVSEGHTQNTDTGTTSKTFQLGMENNGVIIESVDSDTIAFKYGGDNPAVPEYADVRVNNITAYGIAYCNTAPTVANHLTNKQYVDNLLTANDAMVFKGTIGTGGTHTSMPKTYEVGWAYKIIEAGTWAGHSAEVGDLFIAVVQRKGSGNDNNDWTVVQADIDGAITGTATVIIDEQIAVFNSNNRVIKGGGKLVSELITKTNYPIHSVITGSGTANTPQTVSLDTYEVLGRKGSGNITGLKTADLLSSLKIPIWMPAAPASAGATGAVGNLALDDNFLYMCYNTNKWSRTPMARTWLASE